MFKIVAGLLLLTTAVAQAEIKFLQRKDRVIVEDTLFILQDRPEMDYILWWYRYNNKIYKPTSAETAWIKYISTGYVEPIEKNLLERYCALQAYKKEVFSKGE